MSLGETQLRPTAMLFRNLASMDVEESIRGNPMDGVVLLMGCDKTTPSLLMGAASCDLPTIGLSGGPMLNGKFRGKDIGSGTGVWQMSEMVRAAELAVEHRPARQADGGQVATRRAHQQRGCGLVAAHQQHDTVFSNSL